MLRALLTRLFALAFVLASLASTGPAGHASQGRDCCDDMMPATADMAMVDDCCAMPAEDADVCGVACLAVTAIAPALDRTPAMMQPHNHGAPTAALDGLPPGPDPAPPKASFPV